MYMFEAEIEFSSSYLWLLICEKKVWLPNLPSEKITKKK